MTYKSEICEVIHQSATAKFEIGAISADRMREFDKMCLVGEGETETADALEHSPEMDLTLPARPPILPYR
jgi:DNA-binding transcriptional regulator YiaG